MKQYFTVQYYVKMKMYSSHKHTVKFIYLILHIAYKTSSFDALTPEFYKDFCSFDICAVLVLACVLP